MEASVEEDKPVRRTTAQSREFGAELWRARTSAGLRGKKVADDLEWSTAKLNKLEKGWRGTSTMDIGLLLGRCGTDKATRDRIVRLANEPNTGYFVREHGGGVGDDLLSLTIHERAAVTLTTYVPMVIPPLLQSEGYARALLTTDDPEVTDTLVRTRQARQGLLCAIKSPTFVFYIHEIALQLMVGGPATMHDQLKHIELMIQGMRKCTIRVVPIAAGTHTALQHASTVLTFVKRVEPLAYGHTEVATVFLEDKQGVEAHEAKHAALSALALDEQQSLELIGRWAETYSRVPRKTQSSAN